MSYYVIHIARLKCLPKGSPGKYRKLRLSAFFLVTIYLSFITFSALFILRWSHTGSLFKNPAKV